ncbi:extracellular solute-binding protein [Paenibacillus nasutitermitis]|uniref:ABC transporter substrate-binding protein n=1 Tax=Paenibacillus nasutitermitis TaxID=1652958 RepID=A0A916Z2I4_9BACL|nr:extracellular solute-binding protein [Paenibacillus nasutitermitis]GGD72948.1 hypothetical protein GCM10010911_33500 [Paenibacillus nasutitermitis]
MRNRVFKAVMVLMCAFAVVAAGCAKGNEAVNTSQGSTSPSASAGNTGDSPSATPKETVELTMVMQNAGLPVPDGIDPNNNEFINIVKEYANVDLKMTVNDIGAHAGKLNLILASNNLPDIVQTNDVDPVNVAADQGAFIDLKKYYDNSEEIQKWITPAMMDMASYKGHYYRLPMAAGKDLPQGSGNYVRKDLLDKFNGGKTPDTIEGYVEVMRKIKEANPNATPLTAYADPGAGSIFVGGNVFFQWYGASPNKFRVQDGQVVSTFVLPEYRAAVELHKQLFNEGLLDHNFATNDWGKWFAALDKDALLIFDGADQLMALAAYHKISKGTEADTSFRSQIAFVPKLASYPAVVKDQKYTYGKKGSPIIWYGLYISSKSKYPDRAWSVFEGLASDKLNEAIYWGREGSEYVVQDGKRIPDAKKLLDPNRYWSIHLSTIRGFAAGQESKDAQQIQVLGQEDYDYSHDSLKYPAEMAEEAGVDMFAVIPVPDEAKVKLPESNIFLAAATVDAITGKITMEQFDKKVEEYKEKYGFIGEAYTKYMNEHKEQLEGWGVKEVNW